MTTKPAPEAQASAPVIPASRVRPARRRRMIVAATSVAAAGGVSMGLVAATVGSAQPGSPAVGNAAATAIATVTYRTLTSQQQVNGTLGYSGSYSIVNRAAGTLTALPSPGRVVRQGQVLYRVDASPVVLLYGSTPAYRALAEGDRGPDVKDLNADLVALGDTTRASLNPNSHYFGAATAAAVDELQESLGVSQTGTLALGQAVFARGPVRVTTVTATRGTPAPPGAVVLQATSTGREVTVSLDAALQGDVKAGDQVTITLPNQRTTQGTVASVSSVATTGSSGSSGGSSSSGPSGGSSSATVQVTITLRDPAATGKLDHAPVQVAITTATAPHALTVPTTALLAQPGGGYGVEVIGPRNSRKILRVSVGLFDDAQGLVQVTGPGLHAGQRVVVPAAP
jgi:putative peptidoglycan binding protein